MKVVQLNVKQETEMQSEASIYADFYNDHRIFHDKLLSLILKRNSSDSSKGNQSTAQYF